VEIVGCGGRFCDRQTRFVEKRVYGNTGYKWWVIYSDGAINEPVTGSEVYVPRVPETYVAGGRMGSCGAAKKV
jgi:hypothetical protein